jgi:hypothetical protein
MLASQSVLSLHFHQVPNPFKLLRWAWWLLLTAMKLDNHFSGISASRFFVSGS